MVTSEQHAHLLLRVQALEHLVVWTAAQEVRRSGDPHSAIADMAKEIHTFRREEDPSVDAQPLKEAMALEIDRLVVAVAFDAHHPNRAE